MAFEYTAVRYVWVLFNEALLGATATLLSTLPLIHSHTHTQTHSYRQMYVRTFVRTQARQTLNSTYISAKYECVSVFECACLCVYVRNVHVVLYFHFYCTSANVKKK